METAVGNDGTMSSMSTTSRTTNDSWDGLFRRSQNLGDRIEVREIFRLGVGFGRTARILIQFLEPITTMGDSLFSYF